MPETLTKLRPDRDLQCYFERPSAIAAMSFASANGFTVSGCWRQQFDWAVVEWNRDNVFEHPTLRNLPDGDLSELQLTYEETRTNCIPLDSALYPTVDWPYLRIWAENGGVESLYKVPLKDHAVSLGDYTEPTLQFELQGLPTAGDYIELAWLDHHFNYRLTSNDTLETAVYWLAAAINAGRSASFVSAVVNGKQITLTYHGMPGSNGNRVGAYGTVHGAGSELWAPAFGTFAGGVAPSKWRISLNFGSLIDATGAAVPTHKVRKMRWTWAADQQPETFDRSEFSVVVSDWAVTGSGSAYAAAGAGTRRIEDDETDFKYRGTWSEARGNYSGGSIHWTSTPGSSVDCAFTVRDGQFVYIGTRMAQSGARVAVQVDGGTPVLIDLAMAGEDILVRRKVAQGLCAGQHTISLTHQGGPGTVFYFDFLELVCPDTVLPDFECLPNTTLATDWDTDHSIAIAPERTAWLIHKLGFHGRANHYAGAMWFYELHRQGHQYAHCTVTFSGQPEFGKRTTLWLGPTAIEHINLIGDSAESIATAFRLVINAGSTGVWAQSDGATLTITSRTMGEAGNSLTLDVQTNSTTFSANLSSPALAGGTDGVWRTDTEATPKINRAARDWTRAFVEALKGYEIPVTVAFSMELQHGDDTPAAGIAQRYPNGDGVWLNTPALQTNFGPQSTAFWREVHREMAELMRSAGVVPYLQFGEVQWWYFAAASGMPFYDEYTRSVFQARYGRPLPTILSDLTAPDGYSDECAFLASLIGDFTSAIMAHVRASHPDARFEVLYPPDVNDTPLNRLVNFPRLHWTPQTLCALKTENFTYTGNRNVNQAAASIQLPMQLGFGREQSSHLVGIGEYTTPWAKEVRIAAGEQLESIVLFALDQFCLIGYDLPLERGSRRAQFQGAS